MKKIREYVVPKYIYLIWLTLVLAAGLGIFRGEWSTVFISIATLGVSLYAVWLSQKISFRIPSALLTASIIFVYATLFLGEVHNFYERFWWWDAVLHAGSAIGFGLIGAIILILLFKQEKVKASPIIISLFTFAFAMAIGGVWEIFEFIMDQIFGMSMQKSGLVDTMYDLIVDSVGALLAAVISYAYLTKNKPIPLTGVLDEAIKNN